MAAVGGASFVGGLAESAVLVLLTLTADGLLRGTGAVELMGRPFPQRDIVMFALFMVVVRVVMTIGGSIASARFISGITGMAQHKVMEAYLASNYVRRTSRPIGDLNAVMVSHARLTGELAGGFTVIAASLCGLLAFGGMSLVVNPIATLGIAALGLVVLSLMRPLRSRSRRASTSLADAVRMLGQEVSEVELLQREIQLFQVGDRALTRISREIHGEIKAIERVKALSAATPQLFQTALLASAVVSLFVVVERMDGTGLASVGAVVLLLIRSMSSAQQFVTGYQNTIDLAPYGEGVDELITSLTTDPTDFGNLRPEIVTPIRLRDVSFAYDGNSNVLANVDLEMRKGDVIGVVGPSGAGKSTFVELLLRLREPTAGKIVGGATNWGDIDPADFAKRVAFVPQQAILINGTVAENVDLFRGLPESRIIQAIRDANLEAEVANLPHGIHTRLGPDDRALSGGQRQRLTIARALAGDPEILILDEPTSALDAVSEAAIRRTLDELREGRVVIIVAHRFSTLRSCSRIVALNNGRVEADSGPDDVADQSQFFHAMMRNEVNTVETETEDS